MAADEQVKPADEGRRSSEGLGLVDERAKFLAWLSAYAGGGEHWRGKVLMGEHDIALALWNDKRREIERLRKLLGAAVRKNEHDMLLTGDELRTCRKALEA